jgi:hypothetical protein
MYIIMIAAGFSSKQYKAEKGMMKNPFPEDHIELSEKTSGTKCLSLRFFI